MATIKNYKWDWRTSFRLKNRLFIFLLISSLPIQVIHAFYATLGSNFRNFSSQDGLNSNMIFCIHKDHKGFMWFGTNCGLSKYDSQNFHNYTINNDFNVSVSKIEENSKRILFLLSNDWLTLFDCEKETIIPLKIQLKNRKCQFTDFTLINDSVVITCNQQTFLKIKISQRNNKPYAKIAKNYFCPLRKNETLVRICRIPKKNVFFVVTNYGRILLMDWSKMQILKSVQLQFNNKETSISSVSCMNGNIWITTMSHGIYIYDFNLQKVKHLANTNELNNILSHNDVYSISSLSSDVYVAATWFGYTIIRRDMNKWNTEIFQQIPCDVEQKVETRMISSYYDSTGILWIGTHGGGIIMIDLRWNFYKRYNQKCDNETKSIIADNKGRLYLSTYHLGIMRSTTSFQMEEPNLEFETIPVPGISTTYLCSVKDKAGGLWFGNKDGNVVYYDPVHESYRIYSTFFHLHISVNTIFLDGKQRFWVGTSNGLYLLNEKFSLEKKLLLNTNILDIKEDETQNIWVATGIGLYKLKEKNHTWESTQCELIKSVNTAQCILAAPDGNVYVGFKNGLGIIRNDDTRFSKFLTTTDGLCSNWINCMIKGMDDDIWIGSNSGITRYNWKSKCYNYYISGSNWTVNRVGEILLWGGSKHIVYFDPKKAILALESNHQNKVCITNLKVNGRQIRTGKEYNKQVILKKQITYTKEINLNHENRNFSLSFSNFSYTYGMQKYEYRLYPYQKEWTISNNEEVFYSNISAGKYLFQVRAIYPENYNSEISDLKITVLPHWSQSWIFRVIMSIIIVSISFLLLRKIKQQQRRREQVLCLKHELEIANMLKEQEKNISKKREYFFTQIAHELRTPLTLILAPLSELLQSAEKEDISYSKLLCIHKSANSMKLHINQLLYIQKMKAGMIKLSISKQDIRSIVERISFSFKDLSILQNISFTTTINYDTNIYIDAEKIESAIKNLLSNAFKYTPPGGSVFLIVYHGMWDDNTYCCIEVKDTGIGIAMERQDQIFEPFTVGEDAPNYSTAIGIGLYIVKSTLELHHGAVKLNSKVGEGSSFTLFIPEGENHFKGDDYKRLDEVEYTRKYSMQYVNPVHTQPVNKKKKSQSILIVEDNRNVCDYLIGLFKDEYNIYEACNGEDGLLKVKKFIPDLILSDVMMPVKDGFEFCRELRSGYSTAYIPIILLTAKSEDADIIKATRIGIDDYLTKPFNVGVLKAKVENLLEQRKQLKKFYSKSLNLKLSTDTTEKSGEEIFMQQVINIIEANLTNETFNAKILSGLLNMSQPTLYRKIKDACQLSIIEVIRNVRITKAASLLLLRKYSVQEVCEMVGYNDYDTFRKHFIAHFKVAPSKYSNTHETNK